MKKEKIEKSKQEKEKIYSSIFFFFQQDFYIWEGRNNINNHQQKLYLPL